METQRQFDNSKSNKKNYSFSSQKKHKQNNLKYATSYIKMLRTKRNCVSNGAVWT
jgi:hypothetical protein